MCIVVRADVDAIILNQLPRENLVAWHLSVPINHTYVAGKLITSSVNDVLLGVSGMHLGTYRKINLPQHTRDISPRSKRKALADGARVARMS